MLRYGTMKAENGGERLARSLNDLALIAAMPDICHTGWVDLDATLPHPEAGLSPFPWSVDYDDVSRSLEVRDAAGKKIADRRFPDRIPRQDVEVIVTILRRSVTFVCRWRTACNRFGECSPTVGLALFRILKGSSSARSSL